MAAKPNSVASVFYDTDGLFQVCVNEDKNVGSLGVWVGDNPMNYVLPVTMCQIFVTLLTSRALYHFLRPIRTPKFICSLLGGIIWGPSFIGRSLTFQGTLYPPKQALILGTVSKIGSVYFVFLIALKMDVVTTLRAAKRCWRFGVIPSVSTFVVTSFLFQMLDPNDNLHENFQLQSIPSIFSISNFAVISEALMELNLLTTELGQLALSSAMINEIISWMMLAYQFIMASQRVRHTVQYLASYCGFIVFGIFVVRPVVKIIVMRTPAGKPIKEVYVVFILLGVLVMSAISDLIGLSFVLGPLLFGLVLPNGPPLATTIIERSEFVVSEILMPSFFMYIGLNTDLFTIEHRQSFITVQCILIVGFLVKVLACVLISPSYNIKLKHGMVLGFMLNIKGIIELMLFSRMRKHNLMNPQTFSQMVLHVVVMTGVSTLLITTLYKHNHRVQKTASIQEGRISTIQNTPRNTEFRIVSCVHHEGNVRSMIALLEACNPSAESPVCVYVMHLIELLGKSTPILLPMGKKNRKSFSVNYPNTNHIMRAFENYSHNSNGPVYVLPHVNVAPYSNMHLAICNLAQDKLVPLLILPFHENDQTLGSQLANSIRQVNSSFLVSATCTVGILVDRHSRLSMTSSKLCFHVAIIFVGGPDDREALALGIRMSERVNTRVTLWRFVVENNNLGTSKDEEEKEQEEEERTFDESLIDEFKAMKFSNDDAVWHEIVVKDCIQVLEAIRGLDCNYDLVMVGKRHSIVPLTDEEMSSFMENGEQLGIIGDMLASAEFYNVNVSVLVMQCGEKRVDRLGRVGSTTSSRLFF